MKQKNSTQSFIKRNASNLVVILCILAIGLTATLVAISNSKTSINQGELNNPSQDIPSNNVQDGTGEVEKPVVEIITFIMPIENATSIVEYSEQLVFNSTLNRYNAHLAMDFFAQEGTDVYAVYDGTVESVTNELLSGTTITIDHGNGLKTVYNSLLDGDSVTVGQQVAKGEVIGQVSTSNRQEYKGGAHLHFEVLENGTSINPNKYLTLDEK